MRSKILALALVCLLSCACAPAATRSAAPLELQPTLAPTAAGLATPTPLPLATAIPPAQPKGESKLSNRLQILQANPALLKASPAEQGRALSLPSNGAGSLRFDEQGRILASIRVDDTTKATLRALEDAGVIILHVSTQYQTISVYIAASDLAAVSRLSGVLNIQEEIAPAHQ